MKRDSILLAPLVLLALIGCLGTDKDKTKPEVLIVAPRDSAVLAPGTVLVRALAGFRSSGGWPPPGGGQKEITRVEFYAGAALLGAGGVSRMMNGNTLTGNGEDGIYVFGGGVRETGTWKNHGVPYVIGNGIWVGSDQGAYLTIEPGSTVKMASGTHLNVGDWGPAGLVADSVTFTSAATSPRRGDWKGLFFYGDAAEDRCRLTRCRIEYGGEYVGNVLLMDARPTITGCHISNSAAWGIYLDGSNYPDPDQLLADNTFSNNDSGNVRRP